jgi:aquaporin Z
VLYSLLVAAVVACAAPLSSFGMNPARLLAVDLSGGISATGWLNLLPPFLGMLAAVEAYRLMTGRTEVLCAKLAHNTHGRCIFRCQHPYRSRALALETLRRRGDGSRR